MVHFSEATPVSVSYLSIGIGEEARVLVENSNIVESKHFETYPDIFSYNRQIENSLRECNVLFQIVISNYRRIDTLRKIS